MDDIIDDVRSRVDPSEAERQQLEETTALLTERVFDAAEELGIADLIEGVTQTGSTARGTFVSGDRDIDLFIEFDASIDEDELEEHGLALGRRVLPDGRPDFASHPYMKGEVDGFDIDLVPCFAVESASEIQSAVDRTPFHTRHLEPKLSEELASDVRVAKRFLKGIGAYGSDVRTQGFSGFLTELLVLEHDGFVPLLEAAASWEPPVAFDPEGHGAKSFSDPLVVIDPTDPERNVAANLSAENVARFQFNARRFLENPSVDFFEADETLDAEALRSRARQRGTDAVALTIPRPDVVEDTLFPQLRRTRQSLVTNLNDRGFDVVRSMEVANDDVAVLFIELAVSKRPAVERIAGPPVSMEGGAENFVAKYEGRDDVFGPFLDGDKLVVERPRAFTDASAFIESEAMLDSVAMGADIESALRTNRTVRTGMDAVNHLLDAGFHGELSAFLDPSV